MMAEGMRVFPALVLDQVARAIPPEARDNVVVIGSLASAYWLLADRRSIPVRTKDIDCVLSPRLTAVGKGLAVAVALHGAGWRQRTEGDFGKPGTSETPDNELPAVRLVPPGGGDWFLELLMEPVENQTTRQWERLALPSGDHYGIPSFPFTSVAIFDARMTEFGIRCALPEMMALAGLLEHSRIKDDFIEGDFIEGREVKRSNKDLGRVLAIAALTPSEKQEEWPGSWERALRSCFPDRWREVARGTGAGLRALLASPDDLQQAFDTSRNSLLADSREVMNARQLGVVGQRLLAFAIEPLEKMA